MSLYELLTSQINLHCGLRIITEHRFSCARWHLLRSKPSVSWWCRGSLSNKTFNSEFLYLFRDLPITKVICILFLKLNLLEKCQKKVHPLKVCVGIQILATNACKWSSKILSVIQKLMCSFLVEGQIYSFLT